MLSLIRAFLAMSVLFFGAPGPIAEAGIEPSARATITPSTYDDPSVSAPAPPEGWMQMPGQFADIHAPTGLRTTALHLSRHAEASIPRFATDLGIPAGATMQIYLAPDDQTFNSLQPAPPPQWADGTAWPQRGLIFLHGPDARPGTARPLAQVLDHEIIHIILGRAFGHRSVPRWLQEGLAQVLAKEYSPELTRRLAAGMLGGSLMSLDDLTSGFPADPVRVQLAYAQAADVVAHIQNEYGPHALKTLVGHMSMGKPAPAAMRAATGLSITELDSEWRAELETSPLWLQPLVSDTMLLGVSGILFACFGVSYLRRRRRVLEQWGKDEAAYDALMEAMGTTPHPAHEPPDGVVELPPTGPQTYG